MGDPDEYRQRAAEQSAEPFAISACWPLRELMLRRHGRRRRGAGRAGRRPPHHLAGACGERPKNFTAVDITDPRQPEGHGAGRSAAVRTYAPNSLEYRRRRRGGGLSRPGRRSRRPVSNCLISANPENRSRFRSFTVQAAFARRCTSCGSCDGEYVHHVRPAAADFEPPHPMDRPSSIASSMCVIRSKPTGVGRW